MSDIVSTLWMIGVDEVNREVIPVLHSAAAEITRLRTELAEAQADIDHQKIITEQVQLDYQGAVDERDTLRQQLAVAREGLEHYATRYGGGVAEDTLAKMEKP